MSETRQIESDNSDNVFLKLDRGNDGDYHISVIGPTTCGFPEAYRLCIGGGGAGFKNAKLGRAVRDLFEALGEPTEQPSDAPETNARLRIGYFADGLQDLLDVNLNGFAAQLLAESYGDKRDNYPEGAVCMRVPDHQRRDVFITVGTEMPEKFEE